MKKTTITKATCVGLALSMLSGLASCTAGGGEATSATTIPDQIETTAAAEEDLPYDFGYGKTFHADQPVTYTMFFSDASWYPMVDTGKTEGWASPD